MTSTILDVNIDRSDPLPLHEQVAARIRRAIADGDAGPGERLPLAKDLAAVLGVNKNTVLRALHLLRDEGLLEFRRGRVKRCHHVRPRRTPRRHRIVPGRRSRTGRTIYLVVPGRVGLNHPQLPVSR
jgi:DNA-binding transcriptional regulator YhcF (GntR family)